MGTSGAASPERRRVGSLRRRAGGTPVLTDSHAPVRSYVRKQSFGLVTAAGPGPSMETVHDGEATLAGRTQPLARTVTSLPAPNWTSRGSRRGRRPALVARVRHSRPHRGGVPTPPTPLHPPSRNRHRTPAHLNAQGGLLVPARKRGAGPRLTLSTARLAIPSAFDAAGRVPSRSRPGAVLSCAAGSGAPPAACTG